MVRRLKAYVGKERIHCFSVVRPVAMTQMRLSRWSGATKIQNNSSLLVIKRTRRVILDFQWVLSVFELKLGRLDCCNRRSIATFVMGWKKHNLCSKCEFRHATPTGKACMARAGVQEKKSVEDDEKLQRGQGPNLVGLDALCDPSDRKNAVEERMSTIEGSVNSPKPKWSILMLSN